MRRFAPADGIIPCAPLCVPVAALQLSCAQTYARIADFLPPPLEPPARLRVSIPPPLPQPGSLNPAIAVSIRAPERTSLPFFPRAPPFVWPQTPASSHLSFS